MNETESSRHQRLDHYLEAVEPTTERGVVGVCLTGSLATGFVDEYSDIDITVVVTSVENEVDPDSLEKTLVPDEATGKRRSQLEKYSFDWDGNHFDIDIVQYEDLRAANWNLETRWEYDNAEVLIDPSGRLAARLTQEVPFDDRELAELTERYADEFLFIAQWDVHKACLRGSFHTAYRAVTRATNDALSLLYLREGEFVPRDKWLLQGLDTLSGIDDEIRALVWEATRVYERNPTDINRRLRALQSLWERLKPSLCNQDLIDPGSLSWDAPPDELCLID